MKKKITIAAYLAGATTLAVSLPVMAEDGGAKLDTTAKAPIEASKLLKSED